MNGHEEGERERSVGVCSVGKNIEIAEIALGDVGRHRDVGVGCASQYVLSHTSVGIFVLVYSSI